MRLGKFKGQRPAGPVADGETREVSAKCLMSLNGTLLKPAGIPGGGIHSFCSSYIGLDPPSTVYEKYIWNIRHTLKNI